MAIADWKLNPDLNDRADAAINWREGQPPSSVNNSARAMMAAIKAWVNDLSNNSGCGGTGNALVFNPSQIPAGTDPFLFAFAPPAGNTGPVVMRIGANGQDLPLHRQSGVDLVSGQLVAGQIYLATRGAGEILLLTDAINVKDVTNQIAQAIQTANAHADAAANGAQITASSHADYVANQAQNNAYAHADYGDQQTGSYALSVANSAQVAAIATSNNYTNNTAWLHSQHNWPVESLRRVDAGSTGPTPPTGVKSTVPAGAFVMGFQADQYNGSNFSDFILYSQYLQYFRQDVGWVTVGT